MPRPLLLIATILTLSLCVTEVVAAGGLNDNDSSSSLSSISLSASSPVATALRDQHAQSRLAPAHALLGILESIVQQRRESNDTLACNLPPSGYVESSKRAVTEQQLGEYPDNCYSQVRVSDAIRTGEWQGDGEEKIRGNLRRLRKVFFDGVTNADVVLLGEDERYMQWDDDKRVHEYSFDRERQTCGSESLFAYRKGKDWYVGAETMNSRVNVITSHRRHLRVMEYVGKTLENSLAVRVGDVQGFTTIGQVADRNAHHSSVVSMTVEENPAILEALRRNEVAVDRAMDQAGDVLIASNIAILALPMIMSLIPVAVVADVNTCVMVWYILFTDLLSALPLLIRGVELVHYPKIESFGTVAYFLGNKDLAQMEVWSAKCSGTLNFHTPGVVCIAVTVAVMVLGVSLELVAVAVMKRRRKHTVHNMSADDLCNIQDDGEGLARQSGGGAAGRIAAIWKCGGGGGGEAKARKGESGSVGSESELSKVKHREAVKQRVWQEEELQRGQRAVYTAISGASGASV